MHRAHTDARVERSNDVHEVLSPITRFASATAARTLVVSRPLLSRGVPSLFTSRTMHSALVSVVSSTVRLSLNYD